MIGGPMLCVGVSTCFRGLKSFCFTLYGLFRFSYSALCPSRHLMHALREMLNYLSFYIYNQIDIALLYSKGLSLKTCQLKQNKHWTSMSKPMKGEKGAPKWLIFYCYILLFNCYITINKYALVENSLHGYVFFF